VRIAFAPGNGKLQTAMTNQTAKKQTAEHQTAEPLWVPLCRRHFTADAGV
jgi:hypothetical protein